MFSEEYINSLIRKILISLLEIFQNSFYLTCFSTPGIQNYIIIKLILSLTWTI